MCLNYVKVHAKLLYLEMMAGNIVNDSGEGIGFDSLSISIECQVCLLRNLPQNIVAFLQEDKWFCNAETIR